MRLDSTGVWTGKTSIPEQQQQRREEERKREGGERDGIRCEDGVSVVVVDGKRGGGKERLSQGSTDWLVSGAGPG